MPIKSWNEDERPREKMIQRGPSSLSRKELLAILINNGSGERSALDLAAEVLTISNNSLHTLAGLSLKELMKVKGIGEAKAVIIKSAMELALRKQTEAFDGGLSFKEPQVVFDYLKPMLADQPREVFVVLLLNKALKLKGHRMLSEGGTSSTVVDVKLVMKHAVEAAASHIIVAHNHPSGNCKPSTADVAITWQLYKAAKLLDIPLLDHVIVSQGGCYSFAETGNLQPPTGDGEEEDLVKKKKA